MIELELPVGPETVGPRTGEAAGVVDDDFDVRGVVPQRAPAAARHDDDRHPRPARRRRTSPPRRSPAALAAWSRVSAMDSPTGWTYRVALNLAHRRAPARRARTAPAAADACRADDGLPPERAIELWDAVRALPPRARTAIALRYAAGLDRSGGGRGDARRGRHRVGDALGRAARSPSRSATHAEPIPKQRNHTMDDLESRLEHQLSGLGRVPLAEPEPVADLRRRARRVRVGRARHRRRRGRDRGRRRRCRGRRAPAAARRRRRQKVQVAAPDFVLGDIDAVVLSSSFDADGARNPLPAIARGDRRARSRRAERERRRRHVRPGASPADNSGPSSAPRPAMPPRTPILFSYHQGDEVHLVSRPRCPARPTRSSSTPTSSLAITTRVGDTVSFAVRGPATRRSRSSARSTFPASTSPGIPLAAMSAAHQPPELPLDRLDVKLAPGADARRRPRRDRAPRSATPTRSRSRRSISFPDQRLAQVEIQHAYWALLSPDPPSASLSGVGPPNAQEKANYQKYSDARRAVSSCASRTCRSSLPTRRRSRSASTTAAARRRSSTDPQTGTATRVNGHWQLGDEHAVLARRAGRHQVHGRART